MIIKQLENTSIRLPAIGQGIGQYTWDESQIEVIRLGIDLGMNFIDTAEIYDNGRSEEIIGKAVKGIRGKVIIGTKFSPEHNSYNEVIKAAERSLRRLQTDYIDLYQMHWPNPSIELRETMSAMEKLKNDGKIRHIGVSNLYLREFREAQKLLEESKIASLQTEYNLFDRIIEGDILSYCEKNEVIIIAYSPLDQGRIVDGEKRKRALEKIADKYNKTLGQIALRWLISKSPVVAIPTARKVNHLKENAAADFDLKDKDIQEIDKIFKRSVVNVVPERIRVSTQGRNNRPVYQTIEEAIENKLGNVPSPVDLAKSIKKEKKIKPVRLIHSKNKSKQYDYDLVEGRIRYWAWVIAYGNRPIPAYVREDWP